ncbi:hypothetical protein LNTAR_21315 [Lentisphaera araneosa HTCC2155]|uniref:HTH gntR-type domain-containing protein n=1 Tax=Lentisphaera araneosa HTCC2155 TaxID=313628 RepID=A6DLZ7_9BACT|nr:GntR family transcriptional regulator [Lentisphaera araneosa]EDM27295.1 hypothetical protein LNTAR_21315 [Lentisphaera araneosa HTCC2155]
MIVNPDSQVAACCRDIVRYIASNELSVGDKLPSQEELRKVLNYSHNSVTPAMNLLVESGMLGRKRGLGTVVLNLKSQPKGLWRIGLAFGLMDVNHKSQYQNVLTSYLQEQSQKNHCHIRFYVLNYDKKDQLHELSHFGMLENDCQAGRLDGIISSAYFSQTAIDQAMGYHIPICKLGKHENYQLKIEYSEESFHALAQNMLNEGDKILYLGSLDEKAHHHYLTNYQEFVHLSTNTPVDSLLELIKNKGFDNIIVRNDVVALELSSLMSQHGLTNPLIIQSNKQVPLYYSTPVRKIELDIEHLAQQALEMTIHAISSQDYKKSETHLKFKAENL